MQTLSPITATELREKLQNGIVSFSYQKKDRTLRAAVGTTKLNVIPAESHPQGIREASPLVVAYYDLHAAGWRCVKVDALIFA